MHRPSIGSWSATFLRTAVLAFGLLAASAVHAEDKVVFQATENDADKWNVVLNNVRNMRNVVGPAATIEIVAYGPAVQMLKRDSALAKRITETTGQNIQVLVCQNTMKGMELKESDMLPDVGYVPSGVVEILHRQQQGYAYIRP